jgi:hypothetical protein
VINGLVVPATVVVLILVLLLMVLGEPGGFTHERSRDKNIGEHEDLENGNSWEIFATVTTGCC